MSDAGRRPFRPGYFKSEQAPSRAPPQRHAPRDFYDWLTLASAVVGVLLVCAGTGVSAYQALVMRQELDSVVAQQRAWLRVQIEPDGPLAVRADGALVPVKIVLSNAGNLPAVGVWTDITAAPHIPLQTANFDELPEVGGGSLCDGRVFPGSGLVVFPGETIAISRVAKVGRRDIDLYAGKDLGFAVRACALYYSNTKDEARRTDRTVVFGRRWSDAAPRWGFARTTDYVEVDSLEVEAPHSGNEAS